MWSLVALSGQSPMAGTLLLETIRARDCSRYQQVVAQDRGLPRQVLLYSKDHCVIIIRIKSWSILQEKMSIQFFYKMMRGNVTAVNCSIFTVIFFHGWKNDENIKMQLIMLSPQTFCCGIFVTHIILINLCINKKIKLKNVINFVCVICQHFSPSAKNCTST